MPLLPYCHSAGLINILKMPNVLLTAHIASASPAAVKQLRETSAHIALKALRGEPLPNVVNGVGGGKNVA